MTVQQIEHHVVCDVAISHIKRIELFGKLLFVYALVTPEVHHPLSECIVHNGIKLIAPKKTFAVMPVLPNQSRVGF